MPYHTSNKKKVKEFKMPKPMMKPRKELSKGQKELMKEHKQHHTKEHMKMMKDLYLFQLLNRLVLLYYVTVKLGNLIFVIGPTG